MKENLKNSGIDIKRVEETPDQSEQYFRQKLEDSLSPSQKVEDLELTEIINVHAIEPLMDNFYKLTNIPIGLNDLKGNVLIGVRCRNLHQVSQGTP